MPEDRHLENMNPLLNSFAQARLFVRPSISGQSLKDFATQMFAWLGMQHFEEDFVGRNDEQVFFGSAVGITVCIAEGSLRNMEKYPFSISLAAQGTQQAADYLLQHAHILAWRLSHEGFRCFVPKDMFIVRSEQDGMVYDA